MNYLRLVRSFSVVTGLVGLIAYAGIVRAQTTPTPEQTPEVEQPNTTPTPVQPTPGVEQPDTTPTPQPPVNGVEQPDTTAPTENTDDLPEGSENQSLTELLQQASASGSFTTLAQAVEAAEIGDALQATGEPYTILAPTDEAFAELPEGALEQLLQPANQGLLRQVLAYHVIPAEVTSNDISTGRVETLGGGIAVQVAEDRIIINDGSVIQADIQAANGVIHVINRVLMPSELRQQIADLL
jgi:uncharacterized surface protein with fasciclin (FAS1) repeats